ncbi:hypothetical protein CYY_009494 [Polysphondylium violaceum]|uniref:SnoaL-like domain-containing protein n=1 Tax=Polysphondylium violaceum TaxID=133409 RepID=A0A8J4PMR5_9MYCE|nr:hypothetical protein CYY_009494 [Polysphondylium violaceum]
MLKKTILIFALLLIGLSYGLEEYYGHNRESLVTSETRQNINAVIDGIKANQIVETFDEWYHQDVEMFENGNSDGRKGKAQNRIVEKNFADNSVIHDVKVLKLLVDEEMSSYLMFMNYTKSGENHASSQWGIQYWKDGLIIREEFWYSSH